MEPKADAFSTIASEASSDGLVSILALGSSKLVVSQSVQQLQRDLPALGTCCRWVGGCGADSLAVSSEGIPVLPRGTVLEPSTRLWAEKKKKHIGVLQVRVHVQLHGCRWQGYIDCCLK